MEDNNIGTWSAKVDNSSKTDDKRPLLLVKGTFPTNGEMVKFDLKENESPGINPTELLLTLFFGSLADISGKETATISYPHSLNTIDDYKTVLINDEDGRKIASIIVK